MTEPTTDADEAHLPVPRASVEPHPTALDEETLQFPHVMLHVRNNTVDATPLVERVQQVFAMEFSGPLPPPAALAAYERLQPGSADRIMRMAESTLEHSHAMERAALEGDLDTFARSQNYAFIVALSVLLGAFVLGMTGHQVTASVIGGLDISAVAAAFLLNGRVSKRGEEKNEKSDESV